MEYDKDIYAFYQDREINFKLREIPINCTFVNLTIENGYVDFIGMDFWDWERDPERYNFQPINLLNLSNPLVSKYGVYKDEYLIVGLCIKPYELDIDFIMPLTISVYSNSTLVYKEIHSFSISGAPEVEEGLGYDEYVGETVQDFFCLSVVGGGYFLITFTAIIIHKILSKRRNK